MYSVDERDRVIELKGVPQSSVGAPMPIVLSNEHRILLGYIIEETVSYGSVPRIVDYDSPDEQFAVIDFALYWSYMFGPPNDEALDGHPLASRGLSPYGSFRIEDSSWIRQLEQMNSVHPNHNPKQFDRLKHLVFTFHDSTFECVAESFIVSQHQGSFDSLITTMRERLWEEFPAIDDQLIF